MGKFTVTGMVTKVEQPVQMPTFTKQTIEITERSEFQGNQKENYTEVTFFNNEINLLAQIRPGQMVTVEGYLSGRKKFIEKDNREFYNYNLKGKSIVPFFQQTQAYTNPVNGAQYGYMPPQQTQVPKQGYGGQPSYPGPQDYMGDDQPF